MIIEITELINRNWNNWQSYHKEPIDLFFIKLNSRESEYGAISILVLSGKNTPLFFIKVARNIKSSSIISYEYNILMSIRNLLFTQNQLSETIPQILTIDNTRGINYVIEKAIEGVNFNKIKFRNKKEKNLHLEIISNWISNFNLATKKTFEESKDLVKDYLDRNIEEISGNRLLQETKYAPIKKSLYYLQERITNYILKYSIPVVCEHGDFSPSNIIINSKKINVIDWEDAIIHGLPGVDLWHFIISYNSQLSKNGKYKNKLPESIFDNRQNDKWIMNMVDNYCTKMELTKEYLWYCLPISLVRAINRDSSFHKNLHYSSKNWMDRLLQYVTYMTENSYYMKMTT